MKAIHAARWDLAAIALVAALFSPLAAAQGNPNKVGALLSASGGAAPYGRSALIGARMAVNEINESGGVLGRPLELITADDQSDATAALNEALRLTQREKIQYMIGPQTSQLAIAV